MGISGSLFRQDLYGRQANNGTDRVREKNNNSTKAGSIFIVDLAAVPDIRVKRRATFRNIFLAYRTIYNILVLTHIARMLTQHCL